MDDPWAQLALIINRALTGYQPDAPGAGRLWIESWHFGLRDPEMRADTLRDYGAWRQLIAAAVRRGECSGVRAVRSGWRCSPSRWWTGWAYRWCLRIRRSRRLRRRGRSWARCATSFVRAGRPRSEGPGCLPVGCSGPAASLPVDPGPGASMGLALQALLRLCCRPRPPRRLPVGSSRKIHARRKKSDQS
jgi:hypothetical protein